MNNFDDEKSFYDKMKKEEEIKRDLLKMLYNDGRQAARENRFPQFPNDDIYMSGYKSINPRGIPDIPDDKKF